MKLLQKFNIFTKMSYRFSHIYLLNLFLNPQKGNTPIDVLGVWRIDESLPLQAFELDSAEAEQIRKAIEVGLMGF